MRTDLNTFRLCRTCFVLVGLVGLAVGAPGWMENYEDMMTSFKNKMPDLQDVNTMMGEARASVLDQWRDLDRRVDEVGDYWGDHFETVGQQMGSRYTTDKDVVFIFIHMSLVQIQKVRD